MQPCSQNPAVQQVPVMKPNPTFGSSPASLPSRRDFRRRAQLPPTLTLPQQELPQPRDKSKAEFPNPECSGHSCSSSRQGAPWPEGNCPQAPEFGNKECSCLLHMQEGWGGHPRMVPCAVLSPELIPENSQALISQHQHKIPSRNSMPL